MPTLSASEYTAYRRVRALVGKPPAGQSVSTLNAQLLTSQAAIGYSPVRVRPFVRGTVNHPNALSTRS
jgi:hypothetical protein